MTVAVGASLLLDGERARVVEFDGRIATVEVSGGRYSSLAVAELVRRARGLDPIDGDIGGDDPGLLLAGLSAAERERVAQQAAHVREVLTGYSSGHADTARPGEPRAEFAGEMSLTARYAAKADELSVTARTVQNWVAAYRDGGEAALVDDRHRRGWSSVDPRWDAAARAEVAAGVLASTPTRSAVLMRVAARLEREHGPGVVPVPSQATAYRRLAVLTKGTNAVSGSAAGRRSIAERPQGVYGRLRATRPGEYLILDTQDLDVFAMEPVTCRWVKAQLTVAQDLFDRQILGLKVTAVSTKAVDVAGVLFEAVTGRSSGRPALGPVHGLPQQLVFTESGGGTTRECGTGESVWCPPETLVVDHGKAFLSAHVIGVCARLGISIQPAQPRKPTDKPTVERFFKSLREGLIQHLPAYKGPDLHSRGLRVEEQAFLFLHELEDVIRDWIVSVYHASDHDGLSVAEWPNLAVSPNEMFAVGIAKAGMLRLPATPELVFEFLRVAWRTIQHYGVEIDGRRYNGPALDGHRNATSPYGGVAAGKWPIRVNDDDVRFVYFQQPDGESSGEPGGGSWHRLDWEHTPMLNTPFSAEAARYARALATKTDRCADPNTTLAQVLARWSTGEVTNRREQRIAARLSAERAAIVGLTDPELADAGLTASAQHQEGVGLPNGQPASPLSSQMSVVTGDDDEEAELLADLDGFYDDALEVLE